MRDKKPNLARASHETRLPVVADDVSAITSQSCRESSPFPALSKTLLFDQALKQVYLSFWLNIINALTPSTKVFGSFHAILNILLQHPFERHAFNIKMRFLAFIPLLFSLAAFVIAFLCVFAGSKPGFMDDYEILSVCTCTVPSFNLDSTLTTHS
jgi:hypothetical protein